MRQGSEPVLVDGCLCWIVVSMVRNQCVMTELISEQELRALSLHSLLAAQQRRSMAETLRVLSLPSRVLLYHDSSSQKPPPLDEASQLQAEI
jgi:hypothetical protein